MGHEPPNTVRIDCNAYTAKAMAGLIDDVIAATTRPVIASHSSARALSDHPRNMTDDMLRAVAKNGGAVCVNFGPQFLDARFAAAEDAAQAAAGPKLKAVMESAPDARSRAAALGIGADDRVLSTSEWSTVDGVTDGLLSVLVAGASLVQCRNADPAVLDRRATAEKATVRLG